MVGTDTAKDLIHSRLKVLDVGPGYCHFPAERDEEYFAGLTAEKMITVVIHGRRVRKWVKKSASARNEPLDCRQYGLAALEILNANLDKVAATFNKRIAKAQEPAAPADAPPEIPQEIEPPRAKAPRPKRLGGFVNGWKR
jgi:phage terminase large subunit GpA-like protein